MPGKVQTIQVNAVLRKKGASREHSTPVVLEVTAGEEMKIVGAKVGTHELFFLRGIVVANTPLAETNGAEAALPSMTLDFDVHLQITGFCKAAKPKDRKH